MRALFFACGFGHVIYYSHLLPLSGLLVVGIISSVVLALCCFALPKSARFQPVFRSILWLFVMFLWGAVAGSYQLTRVVHTMLPKALDKTTAVIEFDIQQIQPDEHKSRLLVEVLKADIWPALEGRQLPLSWYESRSRGHSNLSRFETNNLQVGQIWSAEVSLRRPRGLANPKGFDYAAWLLAQGYRATGYTSDSKNNQLVGNRPLTPREILLNHVESQLTDAVGAAKAVAFFRGLLMGDRSQLISSDWQVLQATGTVHLMAISGLHIGLVASLGFGIGWLLLRLLSRFLRVKSPRYRRYLPTVNAMFFALIYAYLAGFSIPTQRALIAVFVVNIALAWGVRLSASRWLIYIFVLITLVEPLAWMQQGFWLSFFAVAVLVLSYTGLLGRAKSLVVFGEMQLRLFFAMLIPLILLGLPVSYLSPLANGLAIPVVSFILVPGLLLWLPLSLTPVGDYLAAFLAMVFDAMWWLLEKMAAFDFATAWPNSTSLEFAVALGTAFLCWLAPRSFGLRLWGALLACIALLGIRPFYSSPKLTVLDVGQGLSVVMQAHDQALVYDTGAHHGESFNIGEQVVAPFLRSHVPKQASQNLQLVVSHGDNDHAGGAAPLIKQFDPLLKYGQPLKGMPDDAEPCYQGQSWHWAGADFTVLWPPEPVIAKSASESSLPEKSLPKWLRKSNNRSCVVLLKIHGITVLLPGDIEHKVERQLIEQGVVSDIDILIAPHHGSKTSSSPRFLAITQPEHIIVSAGYKNRYRHPHPDIEKRYQRAGAQIWRTDLQGAISITFDGDGSYSIVGHRDTNPKPWF